ncbi:MAG: hypothetical protein B6245_00305 [Desulfobacteraceae bacterium 4572_88]|nr:MAG: hypothetical protein B6245_00305 [Desulfobacteraceae bacterium 4572_88]
MNRREFLRYQMNGALWLTAAASGLMLPGKTLAEGIPDIGVAKGKPTAATRAAVELLGGMKTVVKPGNKVLIKPNMSFDTPPERASNTHPEVVRELAVMCKEAGASRVMILDHPLHDATRCLKSSGILEACKPVDDQMVHMITDASLYQETKIPNAVTLTTTDIMKDALRADVLIAVPVAKSHSGAGVSLSMKGMMGLIYDRRTMHFKSLHSGIADLTSVLRADLAVIDATRVLSTGGPGGPGKVIRGDMVIASKDMVAADAYTISSFEWYGKKFKPSQVRHIREAHERGLGRMDVENLNVKTVSV